MNNDRKPALRVGLAEMCDMTISMVRMEGDTLLASNDICNSAYNTRKTVTAIRHRLQVICREETGDFQALEENITGLRGELDRLRQEISGQISRLDSLRGQIDEAEHLLVTACGAVSALA